MRGVWYNCQDDVGIAAYSRKRFEVVYCNFVVSLLLVLEIGFVLIHRSVILSCRLRVRRYPHASDLASYVVIVFLPLILSVEALSGGSGAVHSCWCGRHCHVDTV